jgi:hypothetical protein
VTRADLAGFAVFAVLAVLLDLVVLIGVSDQIPNRLGGVGNNVPTSGSCCDMPAPPSGEPQP